MSLIDVPGAGPWRAGTGPADFVPFPAAAVDGSIHDRLAAVARLHADRTAISSPAGRWTYTELLGEVERVATALVARLGSEAVPVAVLARHDGPLVVAILGVIAAGHLVVIVDPAAPAEQVDHVIAESATALVLVDDEMTADAEVLVGRHEGVEAVAASSLARTDALLPARVGDDPVMLAFTSGTTGEPKAAVITHGVILNVVRGATNALGVTAADRMPMLFPTSLAVAAYPMFIPLLNGGTLATLDVRSVGLAPVGPFLTEERITLAYMAPTVVRFLVGAVENGSFPDLRLLALGGEVVDAEVVRLATEMFEPELLANGFGTTETGVISLYVIDPNEPVEGAVPSGYPVEDVDFVVLGDDGREVGRGEPGEIAVDSPLLFRGYWGHDELSAQVFEADPAGRPGWIRYRTGDLGHVDEAGALVVAGRVDTKVKVRGRFVVLGDVEADVREFEGVTDAAVVAVERRGNVELAAVVVGAHGLPDVGPMRGALLDRRESYRVPSVWVPAQELPRLPNGKVDRRACLGLVPVSAAPVSMDSVDAPAAEAAAASADAPATSTARRDELRRALRDLWELLLPVEEVGLDDDFAALGGDSLLAAQMLVMAEQRLGVTVPMAAMLDASTVRTLADEMLRLETEGSQVATCVQAGSPDRPILWFVPDLQGSAYRVRHLAVHLGSDQPVWSFESPLLAGIRNPFRSLDQFAARMITELRTVQPEGPYWIGGYSFGGICAYDMARQLRADGHEVAFLGVVDVGPGYRGPAWDDRESPSRPWFGVAKPPPADADLRARVDHYRAMFAASKVGGLRHVMVATGVARVVDPLRFRLDLARHGRVRPEWRLWYAWEEHWKLAAKEWQRTRPYAGEVDLFWAGDTGSTDGSMGWAPLVGELRIHRFPGFHDDLLEPKGAPALGGSLRAAIDQALGLD